MRVREAVEVAARRRSFARSHVPRAAVLVQVLEAVSNTMGSVESSLIALGSLTLPLELPDISIRNAKTSLSFSYEYGHLPLTIPTALEFSNHKVAIASMVFRCDGHAHGVQTYQSVALSALHVVYVDLTRAQRHHERSPQQQAQRDGDGPGNDDADSRRRQRFLSCKYWMQAMWPSSAA